MNWLEFLSAVIGHLAWPTTVIAVVFLLRKSLVELIPGLERLKYKEFELEFKRRIQEVLPKRIAATNETKKEESVSFLKPREYYINLAGISPRAAILESWVEVEAAGADAYAKIVSPGMKVFMNPREIFQYLSAKGLIESEDFVHVENLRKLRNQAAHQVSLHQLDESLVQEFVDLALDLAARIRKKSA